MKRQFTLPGEAGHEGLTLELAMRWGADAIRDSDGTTLQTAISDELRIDLIAGFFAEQFSVNDSPNAVKYWEVYDRTSETLVSREDEWCGAHPQSGVVRFTSLFYNFAWIWGSDERNRHLFVDWASYDFTVCPEALNDFAKEYSYSLRAEDFVRQGKYNATHRVPRKEKRDWMDFIGHFVRRATRELVDIVHAAGKKPYVFFDDSWVGMEPFNGHFHEMGFDGLIKCVFSGYEARMCADVDVDVHEIRFHPYLFPVGLGGAPTFSPGGTPSVDAFRYWINVRRALLRKKIDRSGLGGYLSLRFADSVLQHTVSAKDDFPEQAWSDTLFMAAFFMLRLGVMEKDDVLINDALNQYYWHIRYLQNRANGLWYHGYENINSSHMSGFFRGRANAWAAYTMSQAGK